VFSQSYAERGIMLACKHATIINLSQHLFKLLFNTKSMNICIIGAGYVGMVTGTCFADMGNNVTFIELEEKKVEKINNAMPPIHEERLDELLRKNMERIKATVDYDALENADIIFICVGTPSMEDGSIDLSYIKNTAKKIGEKLKGKWKTVVVKSTVTPGTTEGIVVPILEKISGKKAGRDFGVAMNPEFLKEGKAVKDFMNPDRIVLGVMEKKSEAMLREIYEPFHAPIFITKPSTAEMIKYASNALLATKISFSNEIGNLCKIMGIDTYEVMKAVGMDHRISPHFLNAGAGFGGSCFPKDLRAIISMAKKKGYEMELLNSVMNVNEKQPLRMINLLEKHIGKLKEKRVAVLGLAFKKGTDDIRDSRAIVVIQELLKREAYVSAYDPLAMENMKKMFGGIEYCSTINDAIKNADACLIMTDWDEFSSINFSIMKKPVVIDGRRVVKDKRGIIYEGICW